MRTLICVLAMVMLPGVGSAQGTSVPAARRLPAPAAISARIFTNVLAVRGLPSGSLIVQDNGQRRVVIVDSGFRHLSTVADTSIGSLHPYGARIPRLIPYLGDSTLLVESDTPAIYLIDPTGRVVRTIAVPRPREAASITSSLSPAGVDALGRLVYRGSAPRGAFPEPKVGEWLPLRFPDSAAVLRVNFTDRQADTIAWYRIPATEGVTTRSPTGATASYLKSNPIETVDDWTVLSDGRVAVVRGADYRIDFIDGANRVTRSPRVPYSWERLTDEGKLQLLDSVRKAREARASQAPQRLGGGASGASTTGGASAGAPPPGFARPEPPPAHMTETLPSDLPDYRPPFQGFGAVRADAQGNLWIRTSAPPSAPTFAVWDVIGGDGKLLDRLEIPIDRTVVGFSASGALYLSGREGTTAWIERVTWRERR